MKTITVAIAFITLSFFSQLSAQNLVHFSATKNYTVEAKELISNHENVMAEMQELAVHITWATNAEIDNEYFTLFRSTDGEHFTELATIHGIDGNENNGIHNYEFFDENYDIIVFDDFTRTVQSAAAPVVYYQLYHNVAGNKTAQFLQQTSFSNIFLPVELHSFAATAVADNATHITWETGSENNNNYFSLQRSFNGVTFEEIATIAGAGTSSTANQYDYFDYTIGNSSIVYYQLVQVDYSGHKTSSNVISVQNETAAQEFAITKLHNNNGSVSMELQFPTDQQNTVKIYSLSNKLEHTQSFANTFGETMNVSNLTKGVYVVECVSAGIKYTQTIRVN